jgi:hypothetical protein
VLEINSRSMSLRRYNNSLRTYCLLRDRYSSIIKYTYFYLVPGIATVETALSAPEGEDHQGHELRLEDTFHVR